MTDDAAPLLYFSQQQPSGGVGMAPHAGYGTTEDPAAPTPSPAQQRTVRSIAAFNTTTRNSSTSPLSPQVYNRNKATTASNKLVYNVVAVCFSWMALTLAWNFSTSSSTTLWDSAADLLPAAWGDDNDENRISRDAWRDLAQRYERSPRQVRAAQRAADQARSVLSSTLPQGDNETPSTEEDSSEDSSAPQRGNQRGRYLKKQKLVPSHKLHHHHHHHDDDNETPAIPEGCETTILILRHCEKGSIQEHCAYMGFERSVYLASLFGNDPAARWPLPVAIFAQAPVQRDHSLKKMNFREIETVGPLARRANVTVDDSYTDETLHDLGRTILQQAHELCGRVVVVAWKHSRIAHLARSLGCGPVQGCPVDYSGKTFDAVWQVRLVYRRWPHSSTHHQFIQSSLRQSQSSQPSWQVFGSVQYEQFDPLAVSKQFGDYPPGGQRRQGGGNWQMLEVAYPERQKKSDTAGWSMKQVGLPHNTNNEPNNAD